MRSIKAISFDLDDTLWECAPVIKRAEASLLDYIKSRCRRIHADYDMERFTLKKVDFMKANSHLRGDVSRMKLALLTEILSDCDKHCDIAEEAFDHFYRVRSDVTFYPDALGSLNSLSNKFPLAALTNGNADLFQIGVTHLFQKIICASLEEPAKPHPYMFEQTCQAFNIKPDQLLHVGDNPETDVEGARRAGVRTVWVNRTNDTWPAKYAPADYEVKDLNQLLAMFDHYLDP